MIAAELRGMVATGLSGPVLDRPAYVPPAIDAVLASSFDLWQNLYTTAELSCSSLLTAEPHSLPAMAIEAIGA
jgi:hypothetical protein